MRESEFVDKLSDFTKSLENLVEILQEQQKNSPTEILNKLLEGFDADAISTIAANVEDVKKNTVEINKNVEKTLKVVQALKKEKEGGIMGEVGDKKNQSKVLDGVKMVILIAAGVLAIGMAFKIVGKVDFLSVVALGMGMMFVAQAFATVASIKDDKGKEIGLKRALMTAGMLVLMSGAIYVSGLILAKIPIIGVFELLTIVGIGVGVGLASYFLLKAIGGLSVKQIAMAPLVPLMIPMIALGIVAAAYILQNMPEIGLDKVWAAILVGVALIPISISFGLLAKALDKADIGDIIMAGFAVPIMAAGIWAASHILQDVVDIPLVNVMKAGLGIGIATLALVPTLFLLKKSGLLSPKAILDLLIGAAAIVIISTAIMLSSWILSVGNYEKFPSFGWAMGVGISLLLFSAPMMVIGTLVALSGGLGFIALAAGATSMLMIAGTLVAVDKIVSRGKWGTYPSPAWAGGVGGSIKAFSDVLLQMTGMSILSKMFGGGDVDLPLFIAKVTDGIISAGNAFAGNKVFGADTKNYPSEEWALGVGGAIKAFSSVLIDLTQMQMLSDMVSFFSLGAAGGGKIDLVAFIRTAVSGILIAGRLFNENKISFSDANIPSEEWAKGVGGSIASFAQALAAMDEAGINVTDTAEIISAMKALAWGIMVVGAMFDTTKIKFDLNKIPSSEWSDNVGSALTAFSDGAKNLEDVELIDMQKIVILAAYIKTYATIMSKTPTVNDDKTNQICNSIEKIINVLPKQSEIDPLWGLIHALNALSAISWKDIFSISIVSDLIGDLSKQLKKIDDAKVESLNRLGVGLHIISLIDDVQLKQTLDAIEAKSNAISEIMDDGGLIRGMFNNAMSSIAGVGSQVGGGGAVANKKGEGEEKQSFEDQLLSYIKNIDTNIGKMADIETVEREEKLESKDVEEKNK